MLFTIVIAAFITTIVTLLYNLFIQKRYLNRQNLKLLELYLNKQLMKKILNQHLDIEEIISIIMHYYQIFGFSICNAKTGRWRYTANLSNEIFEIAETNLQDVILNKKTRKFHKDNSGNIYLIFINMDFIIMLHDKNHNMNYNEILFLETYILKILYLIHLNINK